MTTYFIITSRAPSPRQRGVTYDSAMRFLDVMDRDDLSRDEIMAAYDALYADSAPVGNARVVTMGAASDQRRTYVTTRDGKRIAMAEIERLLALRPRASADVTSGFSQAESDRAFASFNGSPAREPLPVRDGASVMPMRRF
ncbi:MAG: hypothetical protein KF861_02105 [Planctomycetaceae bacterium]|nr:hypothetical protein [Planctomycetaceae bacterium]